MATATVLNFAGSSNVSQECCRVTSHLSMKFASDISNCRLDMGLSFFQHGATAILEIEKWRISINGKVNDGHFSAHAKF